MVNILFVCYGNICRSPMGEFILKDLVKKNNIENKFKIESAGTSAEELGNPVYYLAKEKLEQKGISCEGKFARKLKKEDYEKYDYILAMEEMNIVDIRRIFNKKNVEEKVYRLLDFTQNPRDIEDPWYSRNFDKTYNEILEGCEAFIKYLNEKKCTKRYKQSETDKLAEILKKDGVISVPTDTVYGVCARMNSLNAYDNLVLTKKRPDTKLFPIMCADEEQIKSIATVNEEAEKLIHAFMPGPITLILNKKPQIPDYINNGCTTIAVRMATSKALEDLIRKTESPILITSANQSGEPTCSNLDEIEKSFPVLDGMMEGTVSFGEASTIIDCTLEKLKILRMGPISIEQIKEVIGNKTLIN